VRRFRTFIETLEKVWEEGDFKSKVTMIETNDGNSCGIDGCDKYSTKSYLNL
jgi:protein disulfide-isomerase